MNFDPALLTTQGPMVCVLVIAILYFYRREIRMDRKVDSQQKKCEDEKLALVSRLQTYEDRQFQLLEGSQKIIDKLTDIESNQFKTVQEEKPRNKRSTEHG
jgi:hypothetical protein